MSKEKGKKKTIFEDMNIGSNNYLGVGGGAGQAAMTHKPGKVTLLDLIKQAGDWENEMGESTKPTSIPSPGWSK